MFNRICLYNSKVFIPFIDDYNAFLVAYEYTNSTKANFREQFKLKLPLKILFKPKEVLLSVADNYVFGIQCIIILVTNNLSELQSFIYCNTSKTTLFEIQLLSHLTKNDIANFDLYITNGPVLLTNKNKIIDIYSLSQNTKNKLDLQSVFPAKNFKILQFTSVGQIFNVNPIYVMLLIVSGEILNEKNLAIYALGIDVAKNNAPVIYEKLPVINFFPDFLIKHVQRLEISNICIYAQNVFKISDINWKNSYSVLCTKKQCLVHFNGELKFTTNLPFEDISFIKCDFSSLENFNIIVSSSQKKICLFKSKNDSDELELKRSWDDIQIILLGDILMNSYKQILLLKNSNFDDWLDEYILIDISHFIPVEIQDRSEIPDECLNATLTGLCAKFEAGKTTIAQKECEIEEKIKATLDALAKLSDTLENNKSCDISSFQDSLVDLILNKDENHKEEMDKRQNKPAIKLLNQWTKIVKDVWFLCWTLVNEEEKELYNPTMKIITQEQAIQFTQKIYLHSSNEFLITDKCSKQINPQQIFSIICSINHPMFYTETVKIDILLTWFTGSFNEFENELFLPLEEKQLTINQLSFSCVSLNLSHIFIDAYQDISLIQDLFCMRVLQQKCVFKLTSLYSDISDIGNLLLSSKVSDQYLCILLNTESSKTLLLKNKSSSLYGIHFTFCCIKNKSTIMELFIKQDEELLLFLQFLKQNLPKDIVFIPCGKTNDELIQLKQKLMCAMKEEVDLLASALNIHNIASQIKDYSNLPIQAGCIVIPKKTFLRIRKALVKKESVTDSIVKNICSTKM